MMTLFSMADSLCDAALAVLYPRACAVCGGCVQERAMGVACRECWQRTRVFEEEQACCWKCGAPSAAQVSEEERAAVSCRRCETEAFTAARACGAYEGALRASVLALKREPYVSRHLSLLMLKAQQREPLAAATRVLPVPLHAARLRERGFNQAALLAQELARRARLPFDDRSLTRVAQTSRHRAGMDARSRRESVREAFKVTRPCLVSGQRILLVDDVLTTGATVSACAEVLKDAGASEVFVLTVARPL